MTSPAAARDDRLHRRARWRDDAYSALYLEVRDAKVTFTVLANSEGVWWDDPLDRAQVEKSPFAQAFFRTLL